jgi:NADH:ubiquinone oxidoreductase subunit 6 (subunit J)
VIIFIVIILLGSKIFGSNFDMFGKDANGFEAIGDWFKNNWMLFVKTAIIAVVGTMIFSVVNFIIKKADSK